MARVVTELAPRDRPFGVDFLWDAQASLAIAVATGASFIREVLPGTFETDMGLMQPNAAALLRERRNLGADDVAVLMNIMPEFASTDRPPRAAGVRARAAAVSSLADAILVSGPMAGAEPDAAAPGGHRDRRRGPRAGAAQHGRQGVQHRDVPARRRRRHRRQRPQGDGHTWNPVDAKRVERFLAAARP